MLADELLAWAKLADLNREMEVYPCRAAWRRRVVVEPPQPETRRLLGRWLAGRTAARPSRVA